MIFPPGFAYVIKLWRAVLVHQLHITHQSSPSLACYWALCNIQPYFYQGKWGF